MLNVNILVPFGLYLIVLYLLGLYSWKRCRTALRGQGFLEEYLLGGRSLGGFVLAMTLVATYISGSSFVGGPGTAYVQGLGWVLLAMTQMPTGYLTLAILGKRFAIVARRIKAVTIIDFLKQRYESSPVAILGALSIIFFLFSAMTANWIAAARVLEATGISYPVGLAVFSLTVMFYVTVGGFRAVALTDAFQGLVMLAGTIAFVAAILMRGGGSSAIIRNMYLQNPELLTPFGVNGFLSVPFISSFWLLVGLGLVGLPHLAVRAMSYRDSRSMHRAIIYGTFIAGFLMLGMHLAGALVRGVIPGISVADTAIPIAAVKVLHPWLAGVFLAAPVAAIMSTVDSQLLLVSGTIMKDLYVDFIKPDCDEGTVVRLSTWITAVLGILVFVASIKPPEFLIWLNLFALGGLEVAFFWPLVLGLYWKRANSCGALASMLSGVSLYIFADRFLKRPLGTHPVVLPFVVSGLVLVLVSLMTPRPRREVLETFWGK